MEKVILKSSALVTFIVKINLKKMFNTIKVFKFYQNNVSSIIAGDIRGKHYLFKYVLNKPIINSRILD